MLVHPDLLPCRELVDLRDRGTVEDEHRGLTLGSHRGDQRLHDPGARRRRQPRVALDDGAQARVGRVVDHDDTTPAGAHPRLHDRRAELRHGGGELLAGARRPRGYRGHRAQAGEVGLVVVPGEDLGAVEQPGRGVYLPGPGQELLGALGVVPGGADRDQVRGRPVDVRVVPGGPAGVDPAPVQRVDECRSAGLAVGPVRGGCQQHRGHALRLGGALPTARNRRLPRDTSRGKRRFH